MNIVPHVLAREVRDTFTIERNPIKKRRRNWRVVKHRIDRPGAFVCGDVIYMHPDLVAKLRAQTQPAPTGAQKEG